MIAASLAVILAVALAAGGTLAYLNGTSKTATNEVDNNFNWVKLTESEVNPQTDEENGNITNDAYEIIPGTSQAKDPTVSVSYSVDSYVYVKVTDNSGGLITWTPADGWTLLSSTTNSDGSVTDVYYRLVDGTENGVEVQDPINNVTYYTNSFSVLKDDSISYSSSITNEMVVEGFDDDGTPTFLNDDIKLIFQAYIMQADITGDNNNGSGAIESALACWNAMNAESTAASVTAGNVEVTTGEDGIATTKNQVVVTSADSAYSATVPSGVTIDTDTADIVTDSDGNTTMTLILVVKNIGDNYSTGSGLTVTTSAGQTATVYDISIIGVDNEKNTTVMEIAMDIGTGLYNVKVEHEGNELTGLEVRQSSTPYTDDRYYYDSTTGILYIYTDTFSEYAIYSMKSAYVASNGETGYDTLENAIAANNVAVNKNTKVVYSTLNDAVGAASSGDTVTLLTGTELSSSLSISKSLTINLGVNTLVTSGGSKIVSVTGSNVNVTIKAESGGGITASYSSGYCVKVSASNSTINIVGGTYISNYSNCMEFQGSSNTVNINNVSCTGDNGINCIAENYTVNISNSNLSADDSYVIGAGGNAVFNLTNVNATAKGRSTRCIWANDSNNSYGSPVITIDSGTYTSLDENSLLVINSGMSISAIVIKGGTFSSDPSSYLATGYEETKNADGTYTVKASSAD